MGSASGTRMNVTVAYAGPDRVCVLDVEVPAGSSVAETIAASGMLRMFPEIDLRRNAVGIFNRICNPADAVHAGDRVEIYRPLLADPKEARRRRAEKQRRRRE